MNNRNLKRNTRTSRRCPDCGGGGYIDGSWPHDDGGHSCGKCCGAGWIKWAAFDPLLRMAQERRYLLRTPKLGNYQYSYLEARSVALRPVNLPGVAE